MLKRIDLLNFIYKSIVEFRFNLTTVPQPKLADDHLSVSFIALKRSLIFFFSM